MRADEKQVGGDHYKKLKITPWEYMESVLTHEEFVGYLKGNIIKYLSRKKNGIEDFHKAAHYMQKLDEVLSQSKNPEPTKTQVYGPIKTDFVREISNQLEGINWDALKTQKRDLI